MTRARRWSAALFVTLVWAVLVDRCTAEAASVMEPGAVVTYTDAAGRDWCATVQTIATGVGSTPWAWLTINADPRRVVRVELPDLRMGCSP